MSNAILTPVTLWKDFDETLPLEDETLSEREEDGICLREVAFSGRRTAEGRVRIYAQYFFPAGKEEFPAFLVLFEAGLPFDAVFVKRFVEQGYGVLCVDYCGENGTEKHTVYPKDVDYANYVRAGRAMEYAEPSAKETSWYEWAGVARYAARYLRERKEVTRYGAIGLRTGGEVLFKITPYAQLSCFISVCAAGWLAYRGIDKFAEGEKKVFDEERHRFIAGIDSQSYAPHAQCPVLLISALNDKKYNYDRVYDTFNQINPAVGKAILFSAHGNGLVGEHSLENIRLFLDKYLKERSVYVSAPVNFSVFEDEAGNLSVDLSFDPMGELVEYGYFFTEKTAAYKARDWTRVMGRAEDLHENRAVMPLDVYAGTEKVLLYTFARYSNGFSVTSKIQEATIAKEYRNSLPASRVIYSCSDGINGFFEPRRVAQTVADCFAQGSGNVRLAAGYGGIKGITARSGIVSYRVSEPRYRAPEGASFAFDAYCAEDARITVTFYADEEEETGYSCRVRVAGGGKWKNFVLDPVDFKSPQGASLPGFRGTVSVVFLLENGALVNNVIWL